MLTCLIVASCLAWPGPQAAPPASQPAAPMHWASRLGMRSAQITLAVKVIDRCVLVPDAATYADELKKWSPAGRWPVLIEDPVLSPLFVRRFRPAELVRRESINAPLPEDAGQRRRAMESIVVGSLGGDGAMQTVSQIFDMAKYVPPGIVVASMNDPAWTAAVALAAGRAQPLVWIDDDFGSITDVMTDEAARRLASRIEGALAAMPYSWRALGDDIDAITLCRSLPGAAELLVPEDLRIVKQGQYAQGTTSVTDHLGRHADSSRYAFTGWIFGDEARSAYMAMCSLFLPRDSVSLLNAYANEGDWGAYRMDGAADAFGQGGFTVLSSAGPTDMGEAGWRRLLVGGVSSDVVWMNSGGNDDFFILNGGQARPGDIPVLNQPSIVHLIHSWSLKSPARRDRVGGRWLEHGAYAMVGSCFEPFLATFVPPEALAARCLGGAPFLIAARYWPDDPRSKPWRIVTIGDPLMLVPPVHALPIQRVNQPAGYGENLLERARMLMKKADADNDAAALAESIRLLDMLGQDDIALQMWALAQQKDMHSGRAAAAILPVLFRRRDADGFIAAWSEGGPRNPIVFDMLWHLMGPRLAATTDRDLLLQMQAAVRPDMPAVDVERLAPVLQRAFGRDHARSFIQQEISRAGDAEQQAQLREFAKGF